MAEPSDATSPIDIRAQLGRAYDRFDAGEESRHLSLLRSLRRPQDVEFALEDAGVGRWAVTVCASDILGALSIIAGLFAAYRFEIENADVFTVRLPDPPASSRRSREPWRAGKQGFQPFRRGLDRAKILDVFEVRAPDGGASADTWSRFQEDLARTIADLVDNGQDSALEQVIEGVSATVARAGDGERQLFPVSVELSNDESPDYTTMSILSVDTPGFLFAFSNALAMLNVNIERAEIRTDGGQLRDTFRLTDRRGAKIVAESQLYELQVAAALIKHFTYLLPRSSNPAQALRQFQGLTGQMLDRPDWTRKLRDLESLDVLEVLADLMGVSQFLWEDFLRMQHENLFPVVMDLPALDERRPAGRLAEACEAQIAGSRGGGDPIAALNTFKDREMFRIDLRHITRRIDFRQFSEELTDLAEVVVQGAARLVQARVGPRFGVPTLQDGQRCPWCIFALGKCGGRELGFGSDVELLFLYGGEGTTEGDSTTKNSLYFVEFVREFTRSVAARKERIFEIDLRLRPYGNAGPLATSAEAFGRYYSHDGPSRQFERMALVKLRLVAGDPALADRIIALRDGFVYSGAAVDMDDVAHLRRRQAEELVPPGAVSAKYSRGGLVDLEYFVQARQIAAGYLDTAVRVSNTLDAIGALVEGGHVAADHGEEVRSAYEFIRRLIDALRVVRGHAGDLTIPGAGSREFAYLAQRLQFGSVAKLDDAVTAHMGFASSLNTPN